MTDRPITIVDLRSGRGLGGHCHDYLIALQAALAEERPETISPFLGPDSAKNSRLNSYREGLSAYRRVLAEDRTVVVHNPGTNDFVTMWISALTLGRRRRGKIVTMLYRDPSRSSFGAGGAWLNGVLIALIARMIKGGVIWPTSDSPSVLANWLERSATTEGSVVSTPPLPSSPDTAGLALALRVHDGPLVLVPGRMRLEKGAANYPVVVEAALASRPDCAVALQTSESDAGSAAALAELKRHFGSEPRVQMIDAHLTGAGYGELLRAADVVVLPYDVALYGTGSSGVVGDALEAGATVVAAPIDWILKQYPDDPRIVLVDDPGSLEAMTAAIGRALDHRGNRLPPSSPKAAEFAASWRATVEAARASRI